MGTPIGTDAVMMVVRTMLEVYESTYTHVSVCIYIYMHGYRESYTYLRIYVNIKIARYPEVFYMVINIYIYTLYI